MVWMLIQVPVLSYPITYFNALHIAIGMAEYSLTKGGFAMPRLNVETRVILGMYEVDLLTMQEIADRLGVTKQAIYHRLKKVGRSAFKATAIGRKCLKCGEPFVANRKRILAGRGKYCSVRCYQADVSMHGKLSRHGQREARRAVGAVLGRTLRSEEVVHHIDGNSFNNECPGNLMLFGSNAEHMSFHKGGSAKVLATAYAAWRKSRNCVAGRWSILPK